MFKKLSMFAALVSTLALAFAPMATQAAVTSSFAPGDLIKGSGDTVYYFGTDGRRYVFPNSKTYFTWYTDFSGVKQIPDGLLSTIPLARSNVTYRPGKKMVKITTDPKVYAVEQGGILRWVATQELAETLYGLAWKNQIDDIADAFFVNYKVGQPLQVAADYKPYDVMTQTTTIALDKQLVEGEIVISIGTVSNGFVPGTVTIKKGNNVTWTNQDSSQHQVAGSGWTSQPLNYQQSYTHVFNTVGSYEYSDTLHSVMTGVINVVN